MGENMKTLKWIGKTLGKQTWKIIFISMLRSVLAVSGVVFAVCLRYVIDNAIAKNKGDFVLSIVILATIIMVQIALRWLDRFVEDDTRAVIENRFRKKIFGDLLNTEYAKLKEYHTGELMNRITSDTLIVTDAAVALVPSLCSMAIRIVAVLIVIGTIELKISLVLLLGGCVLALLSMIPRRLQKKIHKQVQQVDGETKSFLQESLESMLVIRAFGCEDKIERIGEEKMEAHRRVRRKRSHVMNFFGTGLRFCIQCGYLFGLTWCGYQLLHENLSAGTLMSVIQLIGQIQGPFVNIGSTFPKYTSMLASAERLMEFSNGNIEEYENKKMYTREDVYGQMKSIEFQDVSFSYDEERQVLKNENFSVQKGEFVALIGNSGIGKSTIMKLLLSVYQPDQGEISVSLEQGKMKLSELPKGMFSYVPQGNYLMGGSIWEVVGFAENSGNIDREKVKRVCEIACADEFIAELPQGYDTVLGERGHGLSEGQMQRLAVARAIYSECPILLLDEATSALDADTERKLITSLKELKQYTVFLVTHRQNVWELCDRVLERTE